MNLKVKNSIYNKRKCDNKLDNRLFITGKICVWVPKRKIKGLLCNGCRQYWLISTAKRFTIKDGNLILKKVSQ